MIAAILPRRDAYTNPTVAAELCAKAAAAAGDAAKTTASGSADGEARRGTRGRRRAAGEYRGASASSEHQVAKAAVNIGGLRAFRLPQHLLARTHCGAFSWRPET
ncbi:unnamed protein product [Prorocentrum cordatum]|uniref:Uncharacterized protein n=1 Tax=Prorocentrum cordatum TaxID=2364126 RepID=A0ABN9W8W7_9DINO|nr:unnamed protein product [Polarella glacialis]